MLHRQRHLAAVDDGKGHAALPSWQTGFFNGFVFDRRLTMVPTVRRLPRSVWLFVPVLGLLVSGCTDASSTSDQVQTCWTQLTAAQFNALGLTGTLNVSSGSAAYSTTLTKHRINKTPWSGSTAWT